MRMPMFNPLWKEGYLRRPRTVPDPSGNRSARAFSGKLITLEIPSASLTDYLEEGTNTSRFPGPDLAIRCRTQLKLVECR